MPKYRDLGAVVAGISRDKVASQKKFTDRQELDYPMLSDTAGEVVDAYGVRGMFGNAGRISFLIDRDGKIAATYGKVKVAGHAEEVLEDLRGLGD